MPKTACCIRCRILLGQDSEWIWFLTLSKWPYSGKYSHVKKNNNPVDYRGGGRLVFQPVSTTWLIASFKGQCRLSSSWLIPDCLPAGFMCWRYLRKSSPVYYQGLYAESCDLIPSNLSERSWVVSWGRRDVIQWTIELRRENRDWDRERE